MKKSISSAVLLSLCAFPSYAQTLQFEAEIGPDGKVQLVPRDGKGAKVPPSVDGAEAPATTDPQPDKPLPDTTQSARSVAGSALYLVTDPAGAVKGVYTSQTQAASQPLSPGDSLKVLAVSADADVPPIAVASGGGWGGEDYLQEVAKQAGQQLMQAARDNACSYDVLPVSITPTVEVSFSFLAGGSLSISATWETKDLCGDVSEP